MQTAESDVCGGDDRTGNGGIKVMEEREVKIHGIFKHFKNKYYIVEAMAFHSETKEEYVVYRRLYGDNSLWIREKGLFLWISRFNHFDRCCNLNYSFQQQRK